MAWVVDTCVLLDVRLRDASFGISSARCLQSYLGDGLVICPVTYIELAPTFNGSAEQEEKFLKLTGVEFATVDWTSQDTAAAHQLWAEVIRKKRTGYGEKRPVADVLIEAFARRFQGIITRNPRHFATVKTLVPQ